MVGWHHRLNGHEFEQILGDGEGQGSLVCCSPWSYKESDTTERLNNNNCCIYMSGCSPSTIPRAGPVFLCFEPQSGTQKMLHKNLLNTNPQVRKVLLWPLSNPWGTEDPSAMIGQMPGPCSNGL